ncbi:MAG: hypothetical protein ABIH23_16840 [bacterium]
MGHRELSVMAAKELKRRNLKMWAAELRAISALCKGDSIDNDSTPHGAEFSVYREVEEGFAALRQRVEGLEHREHIVLVQQEIELNGAKKRIAELEGLLRQVRQCNRGHDLCKYCSDELDRVLAPTLPVVDKEKL